MATLHRLLRPPEAAPSSPRSAPQSPLSGNGSPEVATPYEDYQRNLEKFRARQEEQAQGKPLRSSSLPALPCLGLGGAERDVLRPSHITHIGGFRREFLHRHVGNHGQAGGGPSEQEKALAEVVSLATAGGRLPMGSPREPRTARSPRINGGGLGILSPHGDSSQPLLGATKSSQLAARIEDHMRFLSLFAGSMESFYDADDGGGLFEDVTTKELARTLLLRADEEAALPPSRALLNIPKACLSTFKAFIAIGILFMPQAVTNAGWAWGMVLMATSAFISTIGILLLGQCHHVVHQSYAEMGRRAFGSFGYWLIAFQLAFSQFGFCTSYVAFICSTVQRICESWSLQPPPTWSVIVVMVLIFIPIGWIRRIGKMKYLTIIGDVIIISGVASVAVVAIYRLSQQGIAPGVVPWANPDRVLVFAGTAVYAFEGIALVIPIRESMEKPEYFPYMLSGMMVFFLMLLTGFGILGYCAWGPGIQTVVLNELSGPVGVTVQIVYIWAVVCSFPLAIFPTFSIVEAAIFTSMAPSSKRTALKNVVRTGITVLMGLFAYVMASNLSIFISILGSFCCIPLAIIFPALLHWKIIGERFTLNCALTTIGLLLIPVTLYVDFSNLKSS